MNVLGQNWAWRFAGPLDHRPHYFVAGGVAQRVHNAAMAVATLAAEYELALLGVESRAPIDKLANVAGRFADDHLDDLAVAQVGAGDERILDVVGEVIAGVNHAGDAALSIIAVRLLHCVFGNDQ